MTLIEFVKLYRDNGEIAAKLCFNELDLSKIPVHLVLCKIPELSNWWTVTGYDWACCLSYHPEHHQYCEWAKFSGGDWVELLIHQPQFAGDCDWYKLDGPDCDELLVNQPQLRSFCHHHVTYIVFDELTTC